MHRTWMIGFLLLSVVVGCGRPTAPAPPRAKSTAPAANAARSDTPNKTGTKKPAAAPQRPAFWSPSDSPTADPSVSPMPAGSADDRPPPPRQIDEAKAAAAGIRKLSGKHLTLYTDLPSGAEVDGLCVMFDLAVPQWCAYFRVSVDEAARWHPIGHLMKHKERFQAAGLYPDDLPPFAHGYTRYDEFWLYEQPSDYYRRHLLLHEATHGFMYALLRADAPPWYMEGMAELMGTHRFVAGQLKLGYFPGSSDEVPEWGRIKIVRQDFKQDRALFLSKVFDFPLGARQRLETYGWCWAAAAFLDGHPRYRERFRQAVQWVAEPDFSQRLRDAFATNWGDLSEEWQLFVANLEYGYDLERTAIDFKPGLGLTGGAGKATIVADRGWQSSGVTLQAGHTYRLKAAGRYQVAREPQPWWCEPGGVTIRYHEGQPLGVLQAAVRPDDRQPESPSMLFRPRAVGLETLLTPMLTGTLYLRINDSPAELADNSGTLDVEVTLVRGQ